MYNFKGTIFIKCFSLNFSCFILKLILPVLVIFKPGSVDLRGLARGKGLIKVVEYTTHIPSLIHSYLETSK